MSAVEMFGEAVRGSFRFDFGVLGIWIFFGLRRYAPVWRTFALTLLWFGMIELAIGAVYGFFGKGPAVIKIFGEDYGGIPLIWISILAFAFFPLELWMYRVLTRPSIRSLFYQDSEVPLGNSAFARKWFSDRDWVWLTISTILALLAMGGLIQASKLRHELNCLQVFTMSVQALDQKTGRPTEGITVSPHPGIVPGQMMKLLSSSSPGSGTISFEYLGAPPFIGTVSITNEGYQQKTVSFDSTNCRLLVYLIQNK
jgi:hypothetical protein